MHLFQQHQVNIAFLDAETAGARLVLRPVSYGANVVQTRSRLHVCVTGLTNLFVK